MSVTGSWMRRLGGLFGVKPSTGQAPASAAKVRIVLIGNCQAGSMSLLLPMLSSRIEVLGVVPIDATADNVHDAYAAILDQADYIVTQSIKDTYPVAWLGRTSLTGLYGGKLIFFTNHFFDGYYPELCYVHDPEGRRHVLPGPMHDYHYKPVIHAYKQGLSAAEAKALCEDEAFHAEFFTEVSARSLAELARREEQVDVRICDYVTEHYRRRRLFFTFNHPTTELLLQSCLRILDLVGLPAEKATEGLTRDEYLQIVSKPVSGPVYRSEQMSFDNDVAHKGVDIVLEDGVYRTGEIRYYGLDELVDCFYTLYDANRERILKYPINFNGLMG